MDKDNRDALQKEREAFQKLDIEYIMATENGRRFIWRMLEYCGIYRDIGGEEVGKQLGNRQAGLYMLGIVSDHQEDQVFKMMKEAKNRSVREGEFYDNRDSNSTSGTSSGSSDGSSSGSGDSDGTSSDGADKYFGIPKGISVFL